jgi:hypothetical protein
VLGTSTVLAVLVLGASFCLLYSFVSGLLLRLFYENSGTSLSVSAVTSTLFTRTQVRLSLWLLLVCLVVRYGILTPLPVVYQKST